MLKCTSCGAEVAAGGRFCSSCGRPVSSDLDATADDKAPSTPAAGSVPSAARMTAAKAVSPQSPRPSPTPGASRRSDSRLGSSSPGGLASEGRFLPGALLAGRYRIVALLGRGGMGEVYRADDMVLDQPVALKFLPETAAENPEALERFRNEVRTARRVAHPNVCRVYDVGEVEGQTFLSMQYVDGEDLAALLRRIGRLPEDKALEIARQISAGLAAAHHEGILHRDLKPANVMLDGRGSAVITDFGLSGLADQIQGYDVRSGTPAYMAPEQLAGKEVTQRSDIYALGLVLYEIFTGKRAFDADTLADLVASRNAGPPSSPSSRVKDLDPAVERVILRCLEPDPAGRPATALAVVAALPGGDPLAAALAAGETPSPEMVAAAGGTAGLRPRTAVVCLAAVLVALAAMVVLFSRLSMLNLIHPEDPPEVLQLKAREILKTLGYSEQPLDVAEGLDWNSDFLRYAERNDKPPRWAQILAGRPSLLEYWYRQSPRYMSAETFRSSALTPGVVTPDDPPLIQSGMIGMWLDYRGRLQFLEAIPPEVEEHPAKASQAPAAVDWNPLFAAAGLDPSKLQPADPAWNSLAASDTRVAWTGVWPGSSRPLRVEAAAWHGKPVFFSLIGPWSRPTRMQPYQMTTGEKAGEAVAVVMLITLMLGMVLLAWRNYTRGKGDRQGAFRLAALFFASGLVLWLLTSHLTPSADTIGLLLLAVCTSFFSAGVVWGFYIALEPYVRRRWPQTIISWSRLMAGRFRDPLVGRDVLFGVMLGMIWVLAYGVRYLAMERLGASPALESTDYLLGGRTALGAWLVQGPGAIQGMLVFFFLLFVLRVLLRKPWLGAAGFVLLFTLIRSLGSDYPLVEVPAQLIIYSVAAVALVRFGLITLTVGVYTADVLLNVPFTLDFSRWYIDATIMLLLGIVILAGWGFYTSLGGQKLLKADLFE